MKAYEELTIEEMRRVARYLAETMGLHSAAGKLVARAAEIERHIIEMRRMKSDGTART